MMDIVTFEQAENLARSCGFNQLVNHFYDVATKKLMSSEDFSNYNTKVWTGKDFRHTAFSAPTKDNAINFLIQKLSGNE